MAIRSFGDKETQAVFETGKTKRGSKWASIKKMVLRKLDMLDYAENIQDLRSPPGNRLEKLKGVLAGYYSIRINDQWRIVFKWSAHGPEDVKVTDYH